MFSDFQARRIEPSPEGGGVGSLRGRMSIRPKSALSSTSHQPLAEYTSLCRKVEAAVIMGLCAGVDGGAVAGEAFESLLGALGPHERTRVLVPHRRPG